MQPEIDPSKELLDHNPPDPIEQPSWQAKTQPPVAPTPPPQQNINPAEQSSAVSLILQWLTYAFWGWVVIAVSSLVAVIVGLSLSTDATDNASDSITYFLAAVIVFGVIAFVLDSFYSKKEPDHKQGPSTVIMVIHGVIYALAAGAVLLGIVFSILQVAINGTSDGLTITISGLVTALVLYGLTLLRIVLGAPFKKQKDIFRFLMLAVVVVVTIWAIAGPLTQSLRLKDDNAVRTNFTSAQLAVNSYSYTKNALPKDLVTAEKTSSYSYDADMSSKLTDLINRGLITYTPNNKKPTTTLNFYGEKETTVYYEMCGTLKYDPGSTTLDGKSATKGKNCYTFNTSFTTS